MAGGKSKTVNSAKVPAPASKSGFNMRILPPEASSKKSSRKGFGNVERSETSKSKDTSRLSMLDYQFSDGSPTREKESAGSKKKGSSSPSKNQKPSAPARPQNVDSDTSDSSDDEIEKGKVTSGKKKAPASPLKNQKQPAPARPKNVDSDESDSSEDEIEPPRSTPAKAAKQKIPSPSKAETSKKNVNKEMAKTSNDVHDSGNTSYESLDDEEEEEGGQDFRDMLNKQGNQAVKAFDQLKANDIREGNSIAMTIPHEDLETFIKNLKESCDVLDKLSGTHKAKTFDWNSITFNDYTGEDLRKLWAYLQNKRRMCRNMWEYANEIDYETKKPDYKNKWIKSHPDFPAKPTGCAGSLSLYAHSRYVAAKEKSSEPINYLVFYKSCIQEFNLLPQEEKVKYANRSSKLLAEYEKTLAEFYRSVGYDPAEQSKKKRSGSKSVSGSSKSGGGGGGGSSKKHIDSYPDAPKPPSNPMAYFIANKIQKLDPAPLFQELDECKIQYAAKFLKLKDSKKMKWINRAIAEAGEYYQAVQEYQKEHPNYSLSKNVNFLSKTELALWEKENGRPSKPPSNNVGIFKEDAIANGEFRPDDYNSEEAAKQEIESRWKDLSWYEKQAYSIKCLESEAKYCEAINKYFEELPSFMRPWVLPTIEKKYRKPTMSSEAPVRSPRKRKPETLATADSKEDVAPVSKKSKKAKKNEEEAFARAEQEEAAAREALAESNVDTASPEKKKKKKKRKENVE